MPEGRDVQNTLLPLCKGVRGATFMGWSSGNRQIRRSLSFSCLLSETWRKITGIPLPHLGRCALAAS